ncbi:MAG: hypothetical protein AB7G87_10575 [Clostridia bacterium]
MKRDKIKTLILVLLVANSLFLTSQIWFSKELWSQDYNFFANWRDNIVIDSIRQVMPWMAKEGQENIRLQDNSYMPQRIVVNYGNNRAIHVNGNNIYNDYLEEVSKMLEMLFKGEQELRYRQIESKDEWLDALKQKSIYIDLRAPYRTRHIGQFFGLKETPLSNHLKELKELIILPGEPTSGDIICYIKNNQDGSVFKYYLKYDKSNIHQLLQKYASSVSASYRFSFELGFDKKQNSKLQVDSFVLFPFSKQQASALKGTNPIDMENDIKDILRVFKYSTNNLRKYTELDDTVVYVENDSTLKIHPNGLIEYDAIQEDKGLLLSRFLSSEENALPPFRQSVGMAVNLMNSIQGADYIQLSSATEDSSKPGSYKFTFNYFYEGLPVRMKLDNIKLNDAVSVEIINGRLKSYHHYVRSYQPVKNVGIDAPVPYVLDNIFKLINNSQNEIKITDLFLDYEEHGTEEILEPQWGIKIEGNKNIFTMPTAK